MREIKFRADDGMDWIYSSAVDYRGEFEQWCIFDFEDEQWLYCGEPQQYTGLIDIKGNQIYHTDLIKDDENFIWEVIYKQGAFYAKCDDLMAEQLLSSVNLFGVVVGNTYEHPELLGDSK
ncbi:YopX family protein [Viridibacillus arvi]|uniref:YopX family protein n=1 Tax=Viridibacillus arvi TaxID=263475 RepID=UPI003D271181